MIGQVRRIIRICLGVLLILLGIAGLFLPLLQGVALIIAGILVLAPNSRVSVWLKRMLRLAVAWLGRSIRNWTWRPARMLRRPFKWLASKMWRKKGADC